MTTTNLRNKFHICYVRLDGYSRTGVHCEGMNEVNDRIAELTRKGHKIVSVYNYVGERISF